LTEGTPFASIGAFEENILSNLEERTKENPFWENYRVLSSILFCFAGDKDPQVSQERDHCVTGQILKTLTVLNILTPKIKSGVASQFDLFEYTHAIKTLEDKIDIAEALKAPSGDAKTMRLRIKGTNKVLKVDIDKLHDALQFSNTDGTPELKAKNEEIELTEEESKDLEAMLEGVELKTNPKGGLDKESMFKVMRLIGNFSKKKNLVIQNESQVKRLEFYMKDDPQYLQEIRRTLSMEEESISKCTHLVLNRLKVNKDQFRKTEREYMMDPILQMELLETKDEGEGMGVFPEDLTKQRTIELIKESNDASLIKFKDFHYVIVQIDPMLIPIVISCLSHDFITQKYQYTEGAFKAAMYEHKVFEDVDLMAYMQMKQFEMMSMAGGMGGMGGMPPMGGLPDMNPSMQ
jgi:hypothetical protein